MVTGLAPHAIHIGSSTIEGLEIIFSVLLAMIIGLSAFLIFMDAPMSESALKKLNDQKKELARTYIGRYGKPITRMDLFKLCQKHKHHLREKNEKEKQKRLVQMQKSQLENDD